MTVFAPEAIAEVRMLRAMRERLAMPVFEDSREHESHFTIGQAVYSLRLSDEIPVIRFLGYENAFTGCQVIRLSDEARDRFLAALAAPPRSNETLRRAVERYSR